MSGPAAAGRRRCAMACPPAPADAARPRPEDSSGETETMGQLSAETRIKDPDIRSVMDKLRAEHSDYEVDTGIDGQWEFRTHYGSLNAVLADRSVLIRVHAEDETCLSYMKMGVAGHIAEHLGTTAGIRWTGDGTDAGTPVFFREITVISSTRIAAHMQRVRF